MTRPFRRLVLYLPGFDPFPPRRYREIFRREASKQAEISGYSIAMAQPDPQNSTGWCANGAFPDGATQTWFEVLVWSDLVQSSMQKGILATYWQLAQTAWVYIASGALFRLMRLRRGPVLAALYPVVGLLLQLLLAVVVGVAGVVVLTRLTGLDWLGWLIGAALIWACLLIFRSMDRRLYVYYLMHDYAFTARLRGVYPSVLETRLNQFSERISAALREDLDEVLVVGHSSGAYLAVSTLADLLRARPLPKNTPALSLLTLGHVVPMASFLPKATRLRADLAWLSTRDELFWLDVTAPGDACSFALCDPVAVTGVAPPNQKWPLVISAAFSHTLSPQMQQELRRRWIRLHFQYLHAFDQPKDYDYFAITCGTRTLAQRYAGRNHSPGRIARAVGPGLP